MVAFRVAHLPLPGAVSAAKMRGSLSPPAPLSCGAPLRRARRGTREAQPRFAFPQRTREIPLIPRLMRRFGKVSNHDGE